MNIPQLCSHENVFTFECSLLDDIVDRATNNFFVLVQCCCVDVAITVFKGEFCGLVAVELDVGKVGMFLMGEIVKILLPLHATC